MSTMTKVVDQSPAPSSAPLQRARELLPDKVRDLNSQAQKYPSSPFLVQREMASGNAGDTSEREFQKGSGSFGLANYGHNFEHIRVSPAPGLPQASLVIGQPGDRFEREADSVANSVMRFPVANKEPLQPAIDSNSFNELRRAPQESEGEGQTAGEAQEPAEGSPEDVAAILLGDDQAEEGEPQVSEQPSTGTGPNTAGANNQAAVQASELPGRRPVLSSNLAAGVAVLRGGGQPLPAASRAFFEPRFGYDLGHIRVHTGTQAGQLARSVQAKAFTVGHDLVFGEGHYQPASASGQWLMAHEITHVLQQGEHSGSTSGGMQVQHTGQSRLQGGFWGDLWSGIKKGASAVWSGISGAAGKVWSGIKGVAGKVWSGIKAVARWGANVLKSGAALAWNLITQAPERVWRLIKHLGSGIAGVASWLWTGLKLAWNLDFKGLGSWLLNGIVSGAAWVGRLIGKLIDIAGVGEVWDLLFQIIKFNTRALTSGETTEAQKTFSNSISYWQVRVDEYSLISTIGAAFQGGGGMGVTTFHTVNFNQKITASPGSSDMHWLTHELTHVSQYEHVGSQYLGEAIHAQATAGYDYKGENRPLWRPASNVSPNTSGKHFNEFNREQQADIAADYYYSLYGKPVNSGKFTPITTDYEPDVDELRSGKM